MWSPAFSKARIVVVMAPTLDVKRKCRVHTFQFGDSFLRHRVGRISVAGVEVIGGRHQELFLVVGDFER
jgi:hypothetical protein